MHPRQLDSNLYLICVIFTSLVISIKCSKIRPSDDLINVSTERNESKIGNITDLSKFEIIEGFRVAFEDKGAESLMNINVDLSKIKDHFTGRGKGKNKNLMQRILPLFIMPFLIQSAIIPMFLSTLKMMLFTSLMVGKLALILIAINALKSSNVFKSRSEESLADIHYGYHGSGMEEYGAYVNKRGLYD